MNGSKFKAWRERTGLTQARIAKLLDVTEMTVYRWETGKAPISRVVQLALKQIAADQERRVK